jgi:hypothetical protein
MAIGPYLATRVEKRGMRLLPKLRGKVNEA